MSLFDPSRANAELRRRLASTEPLGDALRAMFHEDGFGRMELYHAVSDVQGIPSKEAMRVVVHETKSWAGPRLRD
jgi:hypothetical protein